MKVITFVCLKVGVIPLLDNMSLLQEVEKVQRPNLREIMGNDDGSLILVPGFDGFKDKKVQCGIKC